MDGKKSDTYRLDNGCDVLIKLEFEVHWSLMLKLHPTTHDYTKIFITLIYYLSSVLQMVPESMCPGIPVSESLSGTSGVSGLSHVGHRLPLLQEKFY